MAGAQLESWRDMEVEQKLNWGNTAGVQAETLGIHKRKPARLSNLTQNLAFLVFSWSLQVKLW